jgi:alanine racemase
MAIPESTPQRAWVDVDLTAVVRNARTIANRSRTRLLPMVKANGYGLGAVPISRALEAVDPWGFGVATVAEGVELRSAGISRPIVVFSPVVPKSLDDCAAHDLRPSLGDVASLAAWIPSGRPFHLEIDTGVSRAGLRWNDGRALAEAASLLQPASGWEGVFTHFHSSDSDPAATQLQWERVELVLSALPSRPPLVHAANSAAALAGTRYAADLVRPGIFLYGGAVGGVGPEPVARLCARVIATRQLQAGDSVSYGATWKAPNTVSAATLGIGYADGMPRALSNHGAVELGGRRCPILGRVTMDMTIVESGAPTGEVATVFGGLVTLDQQAVAAGTISYELLTSLSPRVERHYSGANP